MMLKLTCQTSTVTRILLLYLLTLQIFTTGIARDALAASDSMFLASINFSSSIPRALPR
jgi:hypothetical protein